MIADFYDYACGRVPYGIWLLVAALISFSFVWWFAWRHTRFWGLSRFWRVLGIGWALAFSLYFLTWSILKPPPIPTRVIVLAGAPGEIAPGPWAEAIASALRRRLVAAPEELTVLDEESAPMAFRVKDISSLENAAINLRVTGILQVVQDSDDIEHPVVRLMYRKRSGSRYPVVAEVRVPNDGIRAAMLWTADNAMGLLNLKPITKDWMKLPKTLSDSALTQHYLNFSIRRRGDYDLAAAFFSSEALADSHWSAPRLELAKTRLISQPDYYRDDILRFLLDATRLDRENPEPYILLGRCFLKTRDWEEAESALKLALNCAPDYPQVYYYLSRLLPSRLDEIAFKRPEQLLRRALQLAPGYEAARVALIAYYRNIQPIGEATKVSEQGLKVDPNSVKVLLAASAVELEREHYEPAERYVRAILQQEPTHPEALYNLGVCRFWAKDYDNAIAAFDSSYAHGGTVENLFYIGKIYQDKGEYKKAIEWYQKRFVKMKNQDDMGALSAREKIHYLQDLIAAGKTSDSTVQK